jgi:hypothetical protein
MRFATLADKPAVEAIVMDPRLMTWTAFDGADRNIDVSRFLSGGFTVLGDEGCFLADKISDGRYVVHTNLLPDCRGLAAIRAAREAAKKAFIETDCTQLVSMVPDTIPHALLFAKSMGMRVDFVRKGLWPAEGRKWDVSFLSMSIDSWIRSGECSEKGRWFHDKLWAHDPGAAHPDDGVHDCYVGAAVEMIAAGNVQKAVRVYNHWAAFALYEQIRVLSEQPLRIDIRSHVLRIEDGDFIVEKSLWQ